MSYEHFRLKDKRKLLFAKSLVAFFLVALIWVIYHFFTSRTLIPPTRIYDALDKRKVVSSFSLLDQNVKEHELNYYRRRNAIVIISHGISCPIFQQSVEEIKKLKNNFNSKGVEFLLLNANPQDSFDDLLVEVKTYDLDFPILKDFDQLVARELGITRTAEAIVIDPVRWQIVYRGAIDDSQSYSGQLRANVSHYLNDVLEEFLSGEKVKISNTNVSGCLINFLPLEKVEASHLSYVKDIAPILKDKCFSCHQPNNVAPWVMSDYQTIMGWGAMIKEVVLSRRMPPWGIDTRYGKFQNINTLSSEDKIKLVTWANNGLERGDGEDPLQILNSKTLAEQKENPDHWTLGKPDLVIEFPPEEIPASGFTDYRFGLAALENQSEMWVSAVEVKPSNLRLTHHVFVAEYSNNNEKDLPQDGNTYFGGYTPGYSGFPFPPGTARHANKNLKLVAQQHFIPTGKPEVNQTLLGIHLSKTNPKYELKISAVANEDFLIEKHTRKTITHSKEILTNILLYDLQPHAHYRAKSVKYRLRYPDGHQQMLLSVAKYSFNWQFFYRLKEPLHIPKGSTLICDIEYDNTADNPNNPDPSHAVKHGSPSTEEMFLCYYSYIETDY
jgi:peroxiredoxin